MTKSATIESTASPRRTTCSRSIPLAPIVSTLELYRFTPSGIRCLPRQVGLRPDKTAVDSVGRAVAPGVASAAPAFAAKPPCCWGHRILVAVHLASTRSSGRHAQDSASCLCHFESSSPWQSPCPFRSSARATANPDAKSARTSCEGSAPMRYSAHNARRVLPRRARKKGPAT